MKNVEIKVSDKGIMTITVDTNKNFGLSSSGKSIITASTEGNTSVDIGGGKSVKVGLNVYRAPTEKTTAKK